MSDLSVWIVWLLLGVSEPVSELGQLLDAAGMSASQASESSMRRLLANQGLVACTPGHEPDAEMRANIIAKRTIAASRGRASVGGLEKLGSDYAGMASARSAGVYPGNWNYVTAKVVTKGGGEETCVAFIPAVAAQK